MNVYGSSTPETSSASVTAFIPAGRNAAPIEALAERFGGEKVDDATSQGERALEWRLEKPAAERFAVALRRLRVGVIVDEAER